MSDSDFTPYDLQKKFFQEHPVSDTMTFQGAAYAQWETWIAAYYTLKRYGKLEKLEMEVCSIHCSKSIDMPVVRFKYKGLKIKARNNTFGIYVDVESDTPIQKTHILDVVLDGDEGYPLLGLTPYKDNPCKFGMELGSEGVDFLIFLAAVGSQIHQEKSLFDE